jgi:hypothetical protein
MSVRTLAAVWQGSQHGGSALLMMLAIADFADDKGQAYPSVSTLAEKTRMKSRNANYLLRELQGSGELVIKIGAGPRGTNLYRIALDRLTGMHAGAGVQSGAGVQGGAGVHGTAGGAALQCAIPLHPSAPKPSLTRQEPSPSSASPTKRLPDCPFDQIRRLYNDSLPEEPSALKPKRATLSTKDRRSAMSARWQWLFQDVRDDGTRRATTQDEALDWFARYFAKAWEDDHLAGRSPRGTGHEHWRCDLDFLLTDKGLKRIIEA